MIIFISLVIGLIGLWALACFSAPLIVWSGAVIVYFVALTLTGVIGWLGLLIAAIVFLPPIILFNNTDLRKRYVSRPIFDKFKAVLPPMSDTERAALEAGNTWWEAEMFSGKPDWQYL